MYRKVLAGLFFLCVSVFALSAQSDEWYWNQPISKIDFNGLKNVKKSDLEPGDILCFTGHVGIYIGGGSFIHAANPSKGVIISSLSESYYTKNYITARRIL